jgi:hypothetical protein
MDLFVEGKIEGLRNEKTKKEKNYKKVYFRREMEEGGFDTVVVKDYLNRDWKIGDDVRIPVFTSSYKTKDGVIFTELLAKKGEVINIHVKAQPVRV